MRTLLLFSFLVFSVPVFACSYLRNGLTDEQVTAGLFAVCVNRFGNQAYCVSYSMEHRNTEGCIDALSAPYGFVAYASVFGELVEPIEPTIEERVYPFIYLFVMVLCGGVLLLGTPFLIARSGVRG
ncbi:hypothetical protein BegalDRAFT_0949 [Beggiatoa alba B18LD]|uniref:Uncharacterized protein n=1 Tax=Beggiatoa alba B18LD TaxID=395493 RepID=I3CE13_9GAMM|nr:hypothetical protein [Beggiatoa alba]EIJ41856.1 hypothetical protein BegalDRAFT_0949 [Beggiatoa alba B18LD]